MSAPFDLESLEQRQLLSSANINFADFSSTANLVANGFGGGAITSGKSLRLTDGQQFQARSVWYNSAVPIERFRADFTFRSNPNSDGGDGLTFSLINGPTSTLGADGRGLGYGNITGNSEAVSFNSFNFSKFGSKFGFASNGERPPTNTKMGLVDLHNGHPFKVTITYDGTTLQMAITDGTDKSKSFVASEKIDLRAALGTGNAIVGFTAGTGQNFSTQDILSWSYSGSDAPVPAPAPAPPQFTSPARATPAPVTGTTTTLSALAADGDESERRLKYTWSVVSAPGGGKVSFSSNGKNASKSSIATFNKDGAYVLRCTVTDSSGATATSDLKVRVNQTATSIVLSPAKKKTMVGRHIQFSAVEYDQFKKPMRTQPTFTYAAGAGKINVRTGYFTAPTDVSHVQIGAYANGLIGTTWIYAGPEDTPPSWTGGT